MGKKDAKDKANGGGTRVPVKTIALNKRARHEYHFEQKFEAGLALQGWELKSIRAGRANITESYAVVRNGEQHLIFVRDSRDERSGAQRFVAQPVRIVAQGGDSVTVDGLKGNEMLVVRGASALKAMLVGVGRE